MKTFKLAKITTDKKLKGWFNFIHVPTSTCIGMVPPKVMPELRKLLKKE